MPKNTKKGGKRPKVYKDYKKCPKNAQIMHMIEKNQLRMPLKYKKHPNDTKNYPNDAHKYKKA